MQGILKIVTGLIVALLASTAEGEVYLQKIAATGDAAPESAGTFAAFASGDRPVLNNHGTVAFRAAVNNADWPDGANQALYVGKATNLVPAVRNRIPAPGLPEFTLVSLTTVLLADNGHLAFAGLLAGAGVSIYNNEAAWAGAPDALAFLFREGDQIPGMPGGRLWLPPRIENLAINSSGHVALAQSAFYPTRDGLTGALWIWDGSLNLVAQSPMPEPEPSVWTMYRTDPRRSALSNTGASLISTGLQTMWDPDSEVTRGGLHAMGKDPPVPVVHTAFYYQPSIGDGYWVGESAPGAPANSIFRRVSGWAGIAPNGRVAFEAQTIYPGSGAISGHGIWRTGPLGLEQAHFEAQDGVGFSHIQVNSAGHVFFFRMSGTSHSWLVQDGAALNTLCAIGAQAPGNPAGVKFVSLYAAQLNELGQAAFVCQLTDEDGVDRGSQGLFLYEPGAGTRLLMRSGDIVEVRPGTSWPLRTFHMVQIAGDAGRCFNDLGELALRIEGGTLDRGAIYVVKTRWTPADLDVDGDVDADDLGVFTTCRSGPAMPHAGTTVCGHADLDGDGDVDHDDFGMWQRCYRGPDQPVDPDCAQ